MFLVFDIARLIAVDLEMLVILRPSCLCLSNVAACFFFKGCSGLYGFQGFDGKAGSRHGEFESATRFGLRKVYPHLKIATTILEITKSAKFAGIVVR